MEIKKFKNGFTTFVGAALKPLILILVLTAIGSVKAYYKGMDLSAFIAIVFALSTIVLGYLLLKNKILTNNSKLIIILLWAFIVRVLWLININTVPVSDFNTMYESAKSVLQGNYDMMWEQDI